MQLSTNYRLSWLRKIIQSHFQLILLGCFLIWTSLLVSTTLQIQHSCKPMIHWSGHLPKQCTSKGDQRKPLNISRNPNNLPIYNQNTLPKPNQKIKYEFQNPQKVPTESTPNLKISSEVNLGSIQTNPDIAGGAIGMAVATGVALIAGAPIAVVLGCGIVTWLAIRTALSNN